MSVTTLPRAFATITGSPAGLLHGRMTYFLSAASMASASGRSSLTCWGGISRHRPMSNGLETRVFPVPYPDVIGADLAGRDLVHAIARGPLRIAMLVGSRCDA